MLDVMADEANDILITDGDFELGESTGQHQLFLLAAQKGDFRQSPDVGIGLENFVNGDAEDMLAAIRSGWAGDGQKVSSISYNEQTGKIDYEASYPG